MFSSSMFNWSYWRDQIMLDPTITNLNTGSFGPLPKPVFAEVTRWRNYLAEEPTDFFVRKLPDPLWQARESLARFLGTIPERTIFTSNVSAAINLVASSLKLFSPGEILLSDHEYGAMHWCWERVAQLQGLKLRTFPLPTLATSEEEIVSAVMKAINSQTRLLFISHILSPTGLILPVKKICKAARERGIISVVDGAHAPAMIDLKLDEIGADFYGGNCHKWLLAPTGSGFLVVREGLMDRLVPLHVSWGYRLPSNNLDDRDEFGSTPRIRFLEFEGTRDPAPWLTIPAAIRFQENIGFVPIRQQIRELSQYVRKRMSEIAGFPEETPNHPDLSGALTAFRLPHSSPRAATIWRKEIWKHRIEIPVIEKPDRLMIRFSTHFYNTRYEIDQLINRLPSILHEVNKLLSS